MTLNEYSIFLIRLISLALLLGVLVSTQGLSQSFNAYQKFVPQNYSIKKTLNDSVSQIESYPDPKVVLRRSLIIPGWGQITNKQSWKVPIVYGLLGGLTYYSIHLNKQYHDYRAAFYNLNPNTPDDNRFGPTPGYLSGITNQSLLRQNRNFYRNRRDLMFVFVGLSYALNVIDAYVFAHLRPFDVSDDLSMKASLEPVLIAANYTEPIPSISLSIKF